MIFLKNSWINSKNIVVSMLKNAHKNMRFIYAVKTKNV